MVAKTGWLMLVLVIHIGREQEAVSGWRVRAEAESVRHDDALADLLCGDLR